MGPKRRQGERGLALIEFAIVLPFVGLLVFGVVDFGRAYSLSSRLQNGAREGARFAQTAPEQVATTGVCTAPHSVTWMATHEDGANAWAVNVDKMVGGSPTSITGCRTMQDSAATVQPGDRVRVRVSTPFPILTPIIGQLVGNEITVTASSEVVVQGR